VKYLCMIYYDERTLDALPPTEYQRPVDEALAYDDELRRLGRSAEARAAYERALDLTRQEPERRFLARRIGELPV
jgi:predicted RNA polymerase sigma factor